MWRMLTPSRSASCSMVRSCGGRRCWPSVSLSVVGLVANETGADKVSDGDEPLLKRHWGIQAIGAYPTRTLVHHQNAAVPSRSTKHNDIHHHLPSLTSIHQTLPHLPPHPFLPNSPLNQPHATHSLFPHQPSILPLRTLLLLSRASHSNNFPIHHHLPSLTSFYLTSNNPFTSPPFLL